MQGEGRPCLAWALVTVQGIVSWCSFSQMMVSLCLRGYCCRVRWCWKPMTTPSGSTVVRCSVSTGSSVFMIDWVVVRASYGARVWLTSLHDAHFAVLKFKKMFWVGCLACGVSAFQKRGPTIWICCSSVVFCWVKQLKDVLRLSRSQGASEVFIDCFQ